MKGIITGIKFAPNPVDNIYTVVGERCLSFKCETMLNLYDKITIAPKAAEGEKVAAKSIKIDEERATPAEYKKFLEKLVGELNIMSPRRKMKVTLKVFEEPAKKMEKRMRNSAVKLAKCLITGTPVIVRFHNDADGASGAVSLFNSVAKVQAQLKQKEIAIGWRMNKSIAYSRESYYSDYAFFNGFASIEKPAVLISDFGTSRESEEAIKMCETKYDLIWLDHHPIYNGFPRHQIKFYINPWDNGGNSDFTAGYLLSLFAELLAPGDTENMKKASLIGDFSVHANRNDEVGQKYAIVLDYLTSKKGESDNLTPRYINTILEDKEKFREMTERASRLLSEAVELGVNKVKHSRSRSGMDIYRLDFNHIAKEDDYPLPGRYSSRLQEKLQEVSGNNRTITLVHYGSYISIRATRMAAESVNLHEIVENLKQSVEGIYSFGGHSAAFSIRSDKDHINDVAKTVASALETV